MRIQRCWNYLGNLREIKAVYILIRLCAAFSDLLISISLNDPEELTGMGLVAVDSQKDLLNYLSDRKFTDIPCLNWIPVYGYEETFSKEHGMDILIFQLKERFLRLNVSTPH